MDKDSLEKYKIIIKKLSIGLLMILMVILLFCIIQNKYSIFKFNLQIFSIIVLINIVCYLIYSIILYIRNRIFEKRVKGYNYEPPYNYSPAIASYLLNEKVEPLLDIKSVKLHLLLNGYVKRDNENKYVYTKKDSIDLIMHEKYVYDEIKNKDINNNIFNNMLYYDMEKLNLVKNKKNITDLLKMVKAFIIAFLICLLILNIIRIFYEKANDLTITTERIINLILITTSIFTIFFIEIKKMKLKTALGDKHSKEWKKFKNFLEDYTLINEREEEHYKLLGEYIPYAMSLGLAEKIEKNIFDEQNNIDNDNNFIKNILDLLSDI